VRITFDTPRSSPTPGALIRWLGLDVTLCAALMLLAAVGLITLYSAGGSELGMVERQGIRLAIGFGVMLVLAQVPPATLKGWTPWLYLGGVMLLLAVMFAGDVSKGAQRWLDLRLVRFQPAEVMKLVVPMMVAWYLAGNRMPPQAWQALLALMMAAAPAALIAEQPDLGTALLVASAGLFAIFLAGVSWRLIGAMGLIGLLSAPALWQFMHAYQRQRILTLLNPENDPLGAGYHIIQSKIAIGSGGLYGKGWLNGTQSQLDFLPERSTDFIFAVYGEEFGFLGVILLLAIYALIVWRGLTMAVRAKDTYARLLGGSLSLSFFVYFFVNIGMVSGLLPVVGVPLPLISYGGTSMVTLMAAFGMLMSMHSQGRSASR
jgi:rod shape determining protein RodA